MLLYGLIWMAPMAALMVTAFVRINIVLVLLRQALGSPQIPGNQVLMVLALLLTALVMRPVGERVYTQAILPFTSGQATPAQAWAAGSAPIKTFMVDQIIQDEPPGPSLVALPLRGAFQSRTGRAPVCSRVSISGRGPGLSAERADHRAGDGFLPVSSVPGH